MMLMKSPFMKKELKFEKEKGFFRRTFDFLMIKIHDGFIQAIPSNDIRDMPPGFMYSFGIIVFLLLVALFLIIFILSYGVAVDTQYLSPLYYHDTASPYCKTIPISNSLSLKATQQGYWEGSSGFQYSEASYIASVTNWEVSPEGYADVMNLLYGAIQDVGNSSKNTDLGINLLYWFSFTARPDTDNVAQRFNLIGDPLVVFNRQEISGTISTVKGDCNESSIASFDPAKGILTLQYNYQNFLNNPICNQTGAPYDLGYRSGINSNIFQIKIDVRSLVTALSVNAKVAFVVDLVEITAYRATYTYNDILFNISRYYDPHFPGMTPITCINNDVYHISQCCLTISPTAFAIPVFNHLGNNTEYPMKCNCTDIRENDPSSLSNSLSNCNVFRFLTGFLYYSDIDTPDGILELFYKYNTSTDLINQYAFEPSFLGSYWGTHSIYSDTLFQNQTIREEFYSFCNISVGSCTLVTFSLFDELYDWSISSYYFQLLNGACQDKISTSYENWNKLIVTPFAPLIQDYQKCNTAPTAAFVNQLGITVGTVSALTPLVVLTILALTMFCQFCSGKRIPVVYRQRERQIALNAFATSLLFTRDRKNFRVIDDSSNNNKKKQNDEQTKDKEEDDDILLNIVQALEKEAPLYNDAFKLQAEVDDMTLTWREIKFQQQQQAFNLRGSVLSSPSSSRQSPEQVQAVIDSPLQPVDAQAKENNQPSSSQPSLPLKILNNGKYYKRKTNMFQSVSLPEHYDNPQEILDWIRSLLDYLRRYSQVLFSNSVQLDEKAEGNIWYLINETILLKKISTDLINPTDGNDADVKNFQEEFFHLIYQFFLCHICILLSIPIHEATEETMNQLYLTYQHQYAYQIGNQVFSLHHIHQLVTGRQTMQP